MENKVIFTNEENKSTSNVEQIEKNKSKKWWIVPGLISLCLIILAVIFWTTHTWNACQARFGYSPELEKCREFGWKYGGWLCLFSYIFYILFLIDFSKKNKFSFLFPIITLIVTFLALTSYINGMYQDAAAPIALFGYFFIALIVFPQFIMALISFVRYKNRNL